MGKSHLLSRRRFLRGATCAISAGAIWLPVGSRARGFESPNSRPRVAVIGTGSRWDQKAAGVENGRWGNGKFFPEFADIVSVCDVDADRVKRAQDLVKQWLGKTPVGMGDYRAILDDEDVDAVHIVTPDHWHAKIAIEAMRAGKDVYCEKPLTLTIEEGQEICATQKETGAAFQVGTQQRSDLNMLKAVAMIRDGRLGEIKRVQCAIGSAPTSPRLPVAAPPKHLDWDRWLGPTPKVDYLFKAGGPSEAGGWSRCHYEFRWWYQFSGGKLTDWGAHHVDIATWATGKADTGPISVDPEMVKHPVEFRDGYPVRDDQYNTATEFRIVAKYADGMELVMRHDTDNGILFEGTKGRMFVNRGRLSGKPAEELQSHPLPEGAIEEVRRGPLEVYTGGESHTIAHAANFFGAMVSRKLPVSDVHSHHRALTTCHLAGIAARMGRKIQWDPEEQEIVGDPESQAFVGREYRQRFEIEV